MSNDPAFLFYTGDFTTGTQFFTDEQVGIYIRLLMAQHQHGHLSDKQVKMICRTHDEDVMLKFEKDSDGKFFNKRLEDEIFKRKKYSLSRSENKKGKIKDMLIISKSYDNHMENENENENINEYGIENKNQLSKIKNFQIPEISELVEYFELRHSTEIEAAKFYNFYQSKNWMVGKSKMKDWRAAANGWVLRNKTDFKNGGQKLDRTDQNKMTTIAALHKLNQKIESNEV